jgi:hypothetical protein
MSLPKALAKELLLASSLIGGGLVLLPIVVYWVGQRVVGDYESEAGLWGLLTSIWSGFFSFDLGAWLLVLSPYVTIQLVRLAFKARRLGHSATPVTDSREAR